ncbi:L-lysine exporter family protein LysE/ArgO [Paraburkholderia youngii]|uniref:LysE/ArgO family amino acid transporter n=1 Tax=Paraburkholderia youngii TaxID=2782701 RepID=UPI003D1EF2D2
MLDSPSYLEGLLLGAGLFTSVGPKDALVIRASLRTRHLYLIALVCAGSDALLIAFGMHGFALVLTRRPNVVSWLFDAGILALVCHGLLALRSVLRGGQPDIATSGTTASLRRTLLVVASVSLINPVSWIDTVLVIPAVMAGRTGVACRAVVAGAVTASLIWFLVLTYGTRTCRSFFEHRASMQVLDGTVALLMLSLAAHLVLMGA